MPTFIEENFAMIAGLLLTLIVLLLIVVIWYNVFLSKFFSNKKFRVNSPYEYEPTNESKTFSLNIYNNNVNDTRIIAFGYIYKNHNIDYYKTYLTENKLPDNFKMVIPSRDCIIHKVDAMRLKRIVSDMNKGKRSVKRITSFVSDSQGLTFHSNALMVRKQLAYLLLQDHKATIAAKKLQRMKMRKEQQEVRKKQQIDRKLKRKESFDKIKLRLKSLFHKKNVK